MNAKEANQLSIESCISEIDEVLKKIEEEAKSGDTELVLKFKLKGGTESYLMELGYVIINHQLDIGGDRTTCKYLIRWGNSDK